jgi:uncharacterized phage-associated protein
MYDARHISNLIITTFDTQKYNINLAKINYLIYLADGFFLASSGDKLIRNHIEAYRNGPGIKIICRIFSDFRHRNIDSLATYYNFDMMADVFADPEDMAEEHRCFVSDIVYSWVRETEVDLKSICCEEGAPWWQTYYRLRFDAPILTRRIPHELMADYFTHRYLAPVNRSRVH